MLLQILSGKGAVQIMPFWKLGGKFHFFLRFCTHKQSKTYPYIVSCIVHSAIGIFSDPCIVILTINVQLDELV